MNTFKSYYKQIVKQDCINKFKIDKNKNIPKFKEIILNFRCENFSIQRFATTKLALEIIAQKKGTIVVSKKPNVLLKIQKGLPAGCQVNLKNGEIYSFINKLNIEILPKLKNLSGFKMEKQLFNLVFRLPGNNIHLQEFENNYPMFASLPILTVKVSTNSKNANKKLFIAKSLKIPVL